MNLLFGDAETYFADDYTLRKMSPAEYALDPRYEALGCAFCGLDGAPFYVEGPDMPAFFATIDWPNTFFVSHNALFDAFVFAAQYNVHPGMIGCTLSMARAWIYHKCGKNDLASIARFYGLPAKMGTVHKLKGLNYEALRQLPELHAECKAYACSDVDLCRSIFFRLMRDGFPPAQLEVLDMITKMATKPQFILDALLLHEHLASQQAWKATLLARCGFDNRDALMSDPMLAMILMSLGVDVPKKVSKTTGKEIYAFAKSDKDFTDLEEYPDVRVQAVVAARLGHKSTIEETRTQRLIAISNLQWKYSPPLSCPIPLKFSGAHTHRASGDWKLNLQNLGRTSILRKAIKAPLRKTVVSVDASQIEARMLAVSAKQWDLVQAFREGSDVYAEFATEIYGYPVTKQGQPVERQVGKTGILSLGYGAWWQAFQAMLFEDANMVVGDNFADDVVRVYRQKYLHIPQLWTDWDHLIPTIAYGGRPKYFGCIEIGRQELILPNGMKLRYHNLRIEDIDGVGHWVYDFGPRRKKLWGSKVTENVTQALAGAHNMDTAVRVKKETGLDLAHQVHDQLLYVVDPDIADDVGKYVAWEMSKPPSWMPDAPLAAEYGVGASYGEIDK